MTAGSRVRFACLLAAVPALGAAVLAGQTERPGEDVSAALEELRAAAGVPALVGMAIQDGEVVAWGAAGVRAAGSDEPVTIDDPFHLGSCSKAMTSTLIAKLIEEGVLTWDTKLLDVLPELAADIDPGYASLTIEELMRHRGGIAERERPTVMGIFGRFAAMDGSPRDVRLAVARMALDEPPRTKPGTAYDYSNYGYMTAAAMIERLTDRPWEELIVEKVLRPLGMASAGVGSPSGEGVPVGHTREGDAWKPLPPGPAGILPDSMGPAGLIHSNLADWGKFVHDHMAGERGKDGLLKAETYRRLHRDPEKSGYACGWGIGALDWGWGNGRTLTHNGSDGTWYTVVLALPEWDLAVLVASNCGEAQAVADKARDLLLKTAGFAE